MSINNEISVFGNLPDNIPDLLETFPIQCEVCDEKHSDFTLERASREYSPLYCKKCGEFISEVFDYYCENCEKHQICFFFRGSLEGKRYECSVCGYSG